MDSNYLYAKSQALNKDRKKYKQKTNYILTLWYSLNYYSNAIPKYNESQIELLQKLGSGYFSEVYKGVLKDNTQANNEIEIAVKVKSPI